MKGQFSFKSKKLPFMKKISNKKIYKLKSLRNPQSSSFSNLLTSSNLMGATMPIIKLSNSKFMKCQTNNILLILSTMIILTNKDIKTSLFLSSSSNMRVTPFSRSTRRRKFKYYRRPFKKCKTIEISSLI